MTAMLKESQGPVRSSRGDTFNWKAFKVVKTWQDNIRHLYTFSVLTHYILECGPLFLEMS